MANVLPNGIGASLGNQLATCEPLIMSGTVWYVDSQTGSDGASPAGRTRQTALATLAQAFTNASDHDIIVFLPGHTQTLTGAQTLSKKLTLIGEGQSSGKPTVKFTNNQAAGGLFTVSGTDVQLRNIWLEENAQVCATARVTVSAARFKMVDCYVECGATDTGPAVALASGADSAEFVSSTFISTGTALGNTPESAIKSEAALTCLRLDGLVLSNGTFGFSNPYAMDLSAGAVTRLEAEGVSLLLGARVNLHASTVGWFNPQVSTGDARVGGW